MLGVPRWPKAKAVVVLCRYYSKTEARLLYALYPSSYVNIGWVKKLLCLLAVTPLLVRKGVDAEVEECLFADFKVI